MLPRKAKEFIKPTAEKLGYNQELVEAVTSFYWQQVRHNLSHPKGLALTVSSFGIFSVKPWKLEQFAIKYQGIIDYTELDTFVKFTSVKQLEKRKVYIDKLILELEQLKIKKELIKQKRYGKVDNNNLDK